MTIDVFAHLLTPRYLRERNARAGSAFGSQYARYWSANPGLTNLDIRFRIMDRYPDVRQILTIAGPNIESITTPADAVECARIANDEVEKHDRSARVGMCRRVPGHRPVGRVRGQ